MAAMQERRRSSLLSHSSDAVLGSGDEIGSASRHLSARTGQAAAQLDATSATVKRLTQALADSAPAVSPAARPASRPWAGNSFI
ncbi:MAG: hypothetical protein C0423_00335 [Methylibium sp.]|nr:hypothetical protein [Methylibium sp.]